MPAVIPIIGAVAAAAGAGTSIYEAANAPSAPKPKPTAPVSNVIQPGPTEAQKASVSQTAADINANAPGLSPQYVADNAPIFSGVGNQPGIDASTRQIVNQLFGGGGGAASPGPSTASAFTPAGVTANPGSGFVSNGLSDLFAQQFGVS